MDDDFLLMALEEKLEPAELVELLELTVRDIWDAFYEQITEDKLELVMDALRLD